MAESSLYERLGGHEVLAAAVDLFYRRVLDDPSVAPFFDGVEMSRLVAHQRAFLASALGGPAVFTGRRLADAHRNLMIGDAEYDAVIDHLVASLLDVGAEGDVLTVVRDRLELLRSDVVARTPA